MKLRLSNGVSWAFEFSAIDPATLRAGCKKAFVAHADKFGIGGGSLFLHVLVGDAWATSGQYRIDGSVKTMIGDHTVKRGDNDWGGLWLACSLSYAHAEKAEALCRWVSEIDSPDQRRSGMKIVQGKSK